MERETFIHIRNKINQHNQGKELTLKLSILNEVSAAFEAVVVKFDVVVNAVTEVVEAETDGNATD